MDPRGNTPGTDAKEEPAAPSAEVIQNPNPRANENIRVRTDEPHTQDHEPAEGVGSEITDGEDA